MTGLSRNSVGDLVAELTQEELVLEKTSTSTGARGRPSPTVHPQSQTSVVLAVEILVDSLAVAAIGLGGDVLEICQVSRARSRNAPELVATDVVDIVGKIAGKIPPRTKIYGLGIAIPGLIDSGSNTILLGPNLGWRNVTFGTLLEQNMPEALAISIGNDADLGALAENRRGIATDIDDMLYIASDIGIGGGIISDGALLAGARGLAGEVGHIPVDQDGRTCSCGAIGCWETVIGVEALLNRIGIGGPPIYQAFADSLVAADQGDERTVAGYKSHGYWLGVGLAGMINTLNPEMVVLGGFLGPAYPHLSKPLYDELQRRVMPAILETCVVVPSALGDEAQLRGSGEFAWDRAFSDIARANKNRVTATRLVDSKK